MKKASRWIGWTFFQISVSVGDCRLGPQFYLIRIILLNFLKFARNSVVLLLLLLCSRGVILRTTENEWEEVWRKVKMKWYHIWSKWGCTPDTGPLNVWDNSYWRLRWATEWLVAWQEGHVGSSVQLKRSGGWTEAVCSNRRGAERVGCHEGPRQQPFGCDHCRRESIILC